MISQNKIQKKFQRQNQENREKDKYGDFRKNAKFGYCEICII